MLVMELMWLVGSTVVFALALYLLGYIRRKRKGKAPEFHWMGVLVLSLMGGFFVAIAVHLYAGEWQDIPEGAGEFEVGSLTIPETVSL